MPVSPADVILQQRVSVDQKVIERIDREFRKHADGKWFKDSTFAILRGELTGYQKGHIIQVYTNAGWTRVTVTNSSENGERPGLCEVRAYYPE